MSKKIFFISNIFFVLFFFASEAQALTCISCDTIGGTRVDGTSWGPTTRNECENALYTEFVTRGESSGYREGRIYQFGSEPVSDCTLRPLEEVTGPTYCPFSPEVTFDGHTELSVPGMSGDRFSVTAGVQIGALDSGKCPLGTEGIAILLMQNTDGEPLEIGRDNFEVGPEFFPIASKPLDELLTMLGKNEGETTKATIVIRFPGIPDYPIWTTNFALRQLNVAANNGIVQPVGGTSPAPTTFEVTPPRLSIPLPTLPQFSNFMSLASVGEVGNRYLLIPWIGEYIAALYKYAIGITGILAGIMIVVAGLIWLTAGGDSGKVSTAKSYIESALVGLVIALTSYVLLYAVNPKLVGFEAMKVKFVEQSAMDPFMSHELFQEDSSSMPASGSPVVASTGGVDPSTLIRVDVECLHTNTPVDPRWEEPLKKVADRFCQLRGSNTGWKIVGGGYRPPTDAVTFYVRRCLFRSSCTIPTGNPFTEGTIVVEGGKKVPSNASIRSMEGNESALISALMPFVKTDRPGHGSGLAFDAYCERKEATGRQTHLKPYVPCQLLLEQAFKENGFCRLNHENWHFELTSLKASRSCNENWTIGTLQKSNSALLLDYRSCPQYWAWDNETCLDR